MSPRGVCDAVCYRAFVAALLLQAVKNARRGDHDAWSWLGCDDARELAVLLDIEPSTLQRFTQKGRER